jgi:hypothetical protein
MERIDEPENVRAFHVDHHAHLRNGRSLPTKKVGA